MAYTKKFLVLKELNKGYSLNGKSVNGVLKVECEDGVTEIFISLIGFAALTEGEYYAVVTFGDKRFVYNLGGTPVTFFSKESFNLTGGLACLIAHVAEEITPVAYAAESLGASAISLTESLHFEIENTQTVETTNAKKADIPLQTPAYDDETVATENYYLYEEKETDNERTLPETDIRIDVESQEKDDRKEEKTEINQDETGVDFDQENYYLKIKDDLERLFAENPEDFSLCKSLPFSKWVKINYSENGHYLVGVIYKERTPQYVCYAVPAKYGEKPPSELNGICNFIPLSVFDMQGDGYQVIFQSAKTGKCIHSQKDE